MFILTDGKNYVMENPVRIGSYVSTTSPLQAKELTYKQARSLLNNKNKKLSWVKSFYMVDLSDGEKSKENPRYQGNEGVYIGNKDIEIDESIIEQIYKETDAIMKLSGWNMEQLKAFADNLSNGVSKYDSAESDIDHALQKYREDNNGKRPQAHKMARIGYLLDEIRDKRKHIKQSLRFIGVLEDAITYSYTIEKIKMELENAKCQEYKGRTEYYQKALDLLE